MLVVLLISRGVIARQRLSVGAAILPSHARDTREARGSPFPLNAMGKFQKTTLPNKYRSYVRSSRAWSPKGMRWTGL